MDDLDEHHRQLGHWQKLLSDAFGPAGFIVLAIVVIISIVFGAVYQCTMMV